MNTKDRRFPVSTFLRISTLDELDARAKSADLSRSKFIEQLIEDALTTPAVAS